MGINAQYSSSTSLTGAPIGSGGVPGNPDTPVSTPPSTNAPPSEFFNLVAGQTIMFMFPDVTFQFSRVRLMPVTVPSASTKTVYGCTVGGVFDTTGLPGWTQGSITLPAQPGGRVAIFSTASEKILAEYS